MSDGEEAPPVTSPREQRSALGDLYGRLGRNLGYLAGGTGAAALFNMGALAFNARALSPEEFGVLVLLQAAAVGLNALMSFSPQQPVIQLGSVAMTAGDRKFLANIVGLGLTLDVLAAVLACAVGFLVILLGSDLIGVSPEYRGAAAVFAGSLLFSGYRTSDGLFRLLNRFAVLSLIQGGMAAAIFVVSGLLWFIEGDFSSYVWAWAGILALTSQVQLWTAIYLSRKGGIPASLGFRGMPAADVRAFLSYCVKTWGTSSVESIRSQGDSLLVGAMVTVEAAGIYNVGKQIAGILRKMTGIYSSAIFPEVSALAASRSFQAARRLRSRMILISTGIGAAGVSAVAVIGWPLLDLAFGTRFTAAYGALVILTAAAAAQLVSHTYFVYVQVFVGPGRLFLIYLMATLVFLILTPPLTFWLSIEGTALGQVVFALSLILMGHLMLRRSSLGASLKVQE